ncbi:hypothetical protein L7F22_041119 [Adiantum nelumboides]|nr:hypothetical protein [Adiantum nelumboides]
MAFFVFSLLFLLALELPADSSVVVANGITSYLGINYGMVADNLPPPTEVVELLKSISVTRTRIYSANSSALAAFANSGISVIVGIGDEDVASLTNSYYAANWVQTNIAYYHPATQIAGILVGNEVFSGDDSQLKNNLLPAMENLYAALKNLGLDNDVYVSTAHSQAILSTSFPPSSGAFASDMASTYLSPMLKFLRNAGSPFMINPYPYFAYKANPDTVSLQYALSAAPSTSTGTQTTVAASATSTMVTDPNTGLAYYNLLDAEVDAVYAALGALGYNDIEVIVSETGWPSAGDADEAGATLQNAQSYNSNLIARLERGQGTPAKPNVPLQAFIFALFNEDLKPGPTSERHYGLFQPDRTPVYDFGILSNSGKSTVDPYSVYYHVSSALRMLPQVTTTLAVAAFIVDCLLMKDLILC